MARHEPFRRWALPVAAVIAALLAVAPAFTVAWWLNHDDVSYLIRLEQFASGWHDGGYPRWCPGLAGGKGYPLFEFYPPGLFSLALALDRLVTDQLLALKLSLLLLAFGGGLGAGLLARRLTESLAASVAATAVFTWAPYRLCLLYERGALAEYAGLSLLPWLLLAAELLGQAVEARRPCRRAVAGLAVAFATMLLCHAISAVLAGYLLLGLGVLRSGRRRGATLGLTGLALGLGCGLTAFWSLPAVLHRELVQLELVTSGYYQIALRGANWRQLLLLPQGYPSFHEGNLGLALGLPLLLALGATPWLGRDGGSGRWRWWVLAVLLIPLTLRGAGRLPLWQLPGLAYTQFPWRLLGPLALLGALLCAELLRARPRAAGLVLLLAATALPASWRLTPLDLPTRLGQLRRAVVTAAGPRYEYATTTTEQLEYLTRRAPADPRVNQFAARAVEVVAGHATIRRVERQGTTWRIEVEAQTASRLRVAQYRYHGWRANRVRHGGRPLRVGHDSAGLVLVNTPPGRVTIRLRRIALPAHRAGLALSYLALALSLALLTATGRARPARPLTDSEPAPTMTASSLCRR